MSLNSIIAKHLHGAINNTLLCDITYRTVFFLFIICDDSRQEVW